MLPVCAVISFISFQQIPLKLWIWIDFEDIWDGTSLLNFTKFLSNLDWIRTDFEDIFPAILIKYFYLISIYKHFAIDIADPSSMQDARHMNFVIDLALCGVYVAQW